MTLTDMSAPPRPDDEHVPAGHFAAFGRQVEVPYACGSMGLQAPSHTTLPTTAAVPPCSHRGSIALAYTDHSEVWRQQALTTGNVDDGVLSAVLGSPQPESPGGAATSHPATSMWGRFSDA